MFSFHKPKIYRSNLGCCICKAKSSSSRFTDSNKYENEFERCFRIQEKRSGEICNACVLLVKRWKKLSPENRLTKHWHHVVDARAGPGTKLTNIRRITSSSSAAAAGHHQNSSSSSAGATSSASQQQQQQHHDSRRHSKSDPLPLTSNQSANSGGGQQPSTSSSGGPRRSFGAVNRARAVDTNVSTFTFGETSRRSYMALESNFLNGSSSLNKPQSALSSSAFESVIKRFRQRQQQQQIEATRRQQNRLQKIKKRQLQQQAPGCTPAALQLTSPEAKRKLPIQLSSASAAAGGATGDAGEEDNKQQQKEVMDSVLPVDKQQQQHQRQKQLAPMKRVKRLSESIGSLTVDGIRITSLLDGAVWRKEKTCCGTIFRGLHNEVAVFPKLLRPCQCRSKRHFSGKQTGASKKTKLHPETEQAAPIDDPLGDASSSSSPPPPPPRTTKSGSVSSCDSNTSGTGSMDCPRVDYAEVGGSKLQQRRRVLQRKSELRLRTSTTTTTMTSSSISRDAVSNPSASAQKLNSPGLNSSSSSSEETQSSSGASMSHLMLMEDEEEGLVCELEMEQDFESSTDGSDTLVAGGESQQQQQQEKSSAKKSSNSVVGAAF